MYHKTVVPSNFQLTERQVAERIGKQYVESEPDGLTDEIREAVDAIISINDVLWAKLHLELGGNVTITEDDPYLTYDEMCHDIDENGHLAIFSGGSHPNYYGPTDDICELENIRGRGVHDYWGHYKNGVDFSFWGEFQKWHHQKKYYPPVAHRLLFTEIVCQTGAAWYLNGGFNDPEFEQKPIMASPDWIEFCYEHCPVSLA
ncbi:hypothetical protein ACFQGT_09780 [Natrialbaceae archaeon GCM10025810]|uniref:hypothetical protein n=1 Tax=Halovalidus salilacus TaxID=3075124 RepID=UPI003620C93E